jgi:hypothetical protein
MHFTSCHIYSHRVPPGANQWSVFAEYPPPHPCVNFPDPKCRKRSLKRDIRRLSSNRRRFVPQLIVSNAPLANTFVSFVHHSAGMIVMVSQVNTVGAFSLDTQHHKVLSIGILCRRNGCQCNQLCVHTPPLPISPFAGNGKDGYC